ncbi:MAG: MFS transporter [Thermomicrobium sp.]|nr:MFS transporter [Thermomicrobium sp.]
MIARDARNAIGSLPRDVRLFLLYALSSNIVLGAFALLYNLYLTQLGYQEDFIGMVNSLATGSLALSAIVSGRLLQHRGSWWCLTYGTLLYLLTSVTVAFAERPVAVVATMVLQGIATTFLFVPLMPFVIDHTPPRRREEVAALALSLTSVSATIGSLVAGWIPYALHRLAGLPNPGAVTFRIALLASIVLGSLCLLPLFAMHDAKARPSEPNRSATGTMPTVTGRRATRRYFVAFVLAGGLLSLGNGAVVPFFNVYFAGLGLPTRVIGIIFAVSSLVGALCGLLAPAVARRLGPLRAVTVIRSVPVLFFALLLVWPTVATAVTAFLVRTISISMAWPIDSTLIAELLPAAVRGDAFGFRSAAWNVGFALASLLGGYAIVRYGYGPVFAAYVVFCTAAVLYTAARLSDHPAAHGRAGSPAHRIEPVE